MDGLFNGQLVEMPAILDSLFHKVVNATSILIGVEGWGVVGSHEVVGTSDSKTLYGQMASIQTVFNSTHLKM